MHASNFLLPWTAHHFETLRAYYQGRDMVRCSATWVATARVYYKSVFQWCNSVPRCGEERVLSYVATSSMAWTHKDPGPRGPVGVGSISSRSRGTHDLWHDSSTPEAGVGLMLGRMLLLEPA